MAGSGGGAADHADRALARLVRLGDTIAVAACLYHRYRGRKWLVRGLVKFVPDVPKLFGLALPGSFLNVF